MKEKIKNPELAKEILKMAELDQEMRKAYTKSPSYAKRLRDVDKSNLLKMKRIVKRFGWPTITLVGEKASHLAWLIVQHADIDPKFQEYCLELMSKAEKENGVSKADIAYLTDRILVNRNRPQIYGTQFFVAKNGKLSAKPLKEIEKLDERRKKRQLEPFEIYKKKLERRHKCELA